MVLRLARALGQSLEGWLVMQDGYDLWVAGRSLKLDKVQKIVLDAV